MFIFFILIELVNSFGNSYFNLFTEENKDNFYKCEELIDVQQKYYTHVCCLKDFFSNFIDQENFKKVDFWLRMSLGIFDKNKFLDFNYFTEENKDDSIFEIIKILVKENQDKIFNKDLFIDDSDREYKCSVNYIFDNLKLVIENQKILNEKASISLKFLLTKNYINTSEIMKHLEYITIYKIKKATCVNESKKIFYLLNWFRMVKSIFDLVSNVTYNRENKNKCLKDYYLDLIIFLSEDIDKMFELDLISYYKTNHKIMLLQNSKFGIPAYFLTFFYSINDHYITNEFYIQSFINLKKVISYVSLKVFFLEKNLHYKHFKNFVSNDQRINFSNDKQSTDQKLQYYSKTYNHIFSYLLNTNNVVDDKDNFISDFLQLSDSESFKNTNKTYFKTKENRQLSTFDALDLSVYANPISFEDEFNNLDSAGPENQDLATSSQYRLDLFANENDQMNFSGIPKSNDINDILESYDLFLTLIQESSQQQKTIDYSYLCSKIPKFNTMAYFTDQKTFKYYLVLYVLIFKKIQIQFLHFNENIIYFYIFEQNTFNEAMKELLKNYFITFYNNFELKQQILTSIECLRSSISNLKLINQKYTTNPCVLRFNKITIENYSIIKKEYLFDLITREIEQSIKIIENFFK